MMKKLFTLFFCALFVGQISAQLNFTLKSTFPYNQGSSDIWGYHHDATGVEYAIVGLHNGTSIISLEDPEAPVEIAYFSGTNSIWRDIKTWGTYAYVVNDDGGGLDIIDFSPLPSGDPVKITWTAVPGVGTLDNCHNIYIDENGFAYLAGSNLNGGGVVILDLNTTPADPTLAGLAPAIYAHDVYARDNRLYTSDINIGVFSIYNVADKSNIQLLAQQATPANFTHNTWLSDDGNTLFTTDERANAPVASYDISDLNDIKELDQFRPLETLGDGVIPHNTHVWSNWLVVSYYTDGCIIVDATRPDNLIEVGNFDSFIPATTGFSGAWGAYPFLPSDLVLVSDIDNGLFVLEPNYVQACYIEGIVRSATNDQGLSGATLSITNTNIVEQSTFTGSLKTGTAIPGTYSLEFSHPTHFPKTVEVTVTNGQVTPFDVTLETRPTYSFSGSVKDEDTNLPVEGASVVMFSEELGETATTSDADGKYFFDAIIEGNYELVVGKWGYRTDVIDRDINANGSADLTIKEGYQDNFSLDLGWKVNTNATQGGWERGAPIEVTAPGGIGAITPGMDWQEEDLGNSCYVTGNTSELFDGVLINGTSTLTSPIFDLSDYGEPELLFVSWLFTFNTDSYQPSQDVIEVRINNGDTTITLERISFTNLGSPLSWQPSLFNLKDEIELTDNMKITFEVSTPSNNRVLEAGIDFFEIVDANPPSGIRDPFLTSVSLLAQPNPSSTGFNLNYDLPLGTNNAQILIYNILGQEQTRFDLDSDNGQVFFAAKDKGIYLAQVMIDGKVSRSIRLLGK